MTLAQMSPKQRRAVRKVERTITALNAAIASLRGRVSEDCLTALIEERNLFAAELTINGPEAA